MGSVGERNREPIASELEAAIARTCGVMNATTAHNVKVLIQEEMEVHHRLGEHPTPAQDRQVRPRLAEATASHRPVSRGGGLP